MFKSVKIPDNFRLSKNKQKEYERAQNRAFFYAYDVIKAENKLEKKTTESNIEKAKMG